VSKPSPEFFARIVQLSGVPAEKIAYVGDRVDNDVEPAIAAGMVGVHIRRGPWGHLQEPPAEAIRIRSLDELPEVLP
jgi:FMN phosphatase YigB (HAD superfamily)